MYKRNSMCNKFHIKKQRLKRKLYVSDDSAYKYLQKYKSSYPNVKSIDDTIAKLVNSNVSISRFGDGEFLLMTGRSISFQKHSKLLETRLLEIVNSNTSDCIIGIIDYVIEGMTAYTRDFWYENISLLKKVLHHKEYYNARITWELDRHRIEMFRSLWEGKDIVFVTGAGSEFDYNHELFDNKSSAQVVLGKSVDAFSEYEILLNKIVAQVNAVKSPLVILSLGPTASVLAYDLSKMGIRSLDIGHITNMYDKKFSKEKQA